MFLLIDLIWLENKRIKLHLSWHRSWWYIQSRFSLLRFYKNLLFFSNLYIWPWHRSWMAHIRLDLFFFN